MANPLICLAFGLCLLALAHAQQPPSPQPLAERLAQDPQAYLEWEQQNRQRKEGLRALIDLRKKAAENKLAKEAEIAEADAWAAKLLRLTPAQVDAWMREPVKDEAAYERIAAMIQTVRTDAVCQWCRHKKTPFAAENPRINVNVSIFLL